MINVNMNGILCICTIHTYKYTQIYQSGKALCKCNTKSRRHKEKVNLITENFKILMKKNKIIKVFGAFLATDQGICPFLWYILNKYEYKVVRGKRILLRDRHQSKFTTQMITICTNLLLRIKSCFLRLLLASTLPFHLNVWMVETSFYPSQEGQKVVSTIRPQRWELLPLTQEWSYLMPFYIQFDENDEVNYNFSYLGHLKLSFLYFLVTPQNNKWA